MLSGDFFLVERDLRTETVEPLSLIRHYDSGSEIESSLGLGFGWQFPLWASDVQEGRKHLYALISEREGALIPYRNAYRDHEGKEYLFD